MTRGQRRVHLGVWLVLAPLLLAALAWAWIDRADVPATETPAALEAAP